MMSLASNSIHNIGGQNDHVHVITQGICNKFIEIKFLCGMYGFTAKLSVAMFDYRVSYQ